MKKTVFGIILAVTIMAASFGVLADYTYDDLKQMFVTRDDIAWLQSSLEATFNSLEIKWQNSVQIEVGYQMYRRGISLPTAEGESIDESISRSWKERRESELHPYGGGKFGSAPPSTIAPSEESSSSNK